MSGSEQPTSEKPTPPQAINDAFWAAAELGSGPIVLDRAECMQLLATQSVGRVAYATDAGARILPVNYVLGADCVIFRTVPDAKSSAMHWTPPVPSRSARPMSSSSRVGVVAVGRLQQATR